MSYCFNIAANRVRIDEKLILAGGEFRGKVKQILESASHYEIPTAKAVRDFVLSVLANVGVPDGDKGDILVSGSGLVWEINQFGASTGDVLTWDGSNWRPDTPAVTGVTSVSITPPAAGITQSGSPITSSGSITLALADDLLALESLATTGLAVRSGTSSWLIRTLTGSVRVGVTNGDGVSGNPTIDVASLARGSNQIVYGTGTDITSSADFTFNPSSRLLSITNSSGGTSAILTSGGSNNSLVALVSPTGGGDPYMQFSISSASTILNLGIDNSDSDIFKIHYGLSGLTGSTGFQMNTSSEIAINAAPISTVKFLVAGLTRFNLGSDATGDIFYRNSSGNFTRLAIGATGRVLTVAGGLPSWAVPTSGTVTSVDISGGTTGLTTSGGPVTSSGTITLSGTLGIANGGTGQITANDALNAFLPSQTIHSGEFLTTDGSNASWAAIPAASNIYNSDGTITAAVNRIVTLGAGSSLQFNYEVGDEALLIDNNEIYLSSPDLQSFIGVQNSSIYLLVDSNQLEVTPTSINSTNKFTYTSNLSPFSGREIPDADWVVGEVSAAIAAYTGSVSIETLGLVTTGIWQATPIEDSYGGVPTGGSTGQVLTKTSNADYDTQWSTPSTGVDDGLAIAYAIALG